MRTRGRGALRRLGLLVRAAVAGLFLLALPGMDHPWLDALEAATPAVRRAFLSASERETDADSRVALAHADVELARLRALQDDARWGRQALRAETQERLAQFLAGRGEIAAGDPMVLATLRTRARQRQRLWLGLPLRAAGTALTLLRRPAEAGR